MRLRAAVPADVDVLLGWRNDPAAREMSPHGRQVGMAEHHEWFLANMRNIRIGVVEGDDIGVFRWSVDDRSHVVSVVVAPAWRGRGYGTRLIQLGTEELKTAHPDMACRAVVRQENERSIRAFTAAGYVREGSSPDRAWVYLVRS